MSTGTNFKIGFFIDGTDSGISKLVRNFRRTRSVEEIRPKWSKIRLGIKRFVRDQRRKAQKKKKSILADRKTALTDHDVKSPNNAMTKKN